MNYRIPAFAFALGLSATLASAATEENIQTNFTASADGKLIVSVGSGAIEVESTDGDKIVVDIYRKVKSSSQKKEEEILAERPVRISQDGNTLTIKERQKNSGWSWFGTSMNATYKVRVPAKYTAALDTSGGHVHVTGIQGNVSANTSGGSLVFKQLRGELKGDTSGGGISLEDCQGALKVDTSGGGIKSNGGGGSLRAGTSGGSISVKDFNGPANVDTSGGSITIENVSGDISGSTSGGSINATLPTLGGDVKLETSAGGITLRVPETAAFNLNAGTSGGRVTSDLPVQAKSSHEKTELKGPVNGGGKTVKLHTSGGGIHIKKI
jgi:hypothetical protein